MSVRDRALKTEYSRLSEENGKVNPFARERETARHFWQEIIASELRAEKSVREMSTKNPSDLTVIQLKEKLR